MVRPRDVQLARQIEANLEAYQRELRPLPGIDNPFQRLSLIEQILESVHRVKYVSVLLKRDLSERRADPNDALFDPIKAAIVRHRAGQVDEAFWMVFLFVHFGKHLRAGWRYAREVYSRLGEESIWDWRSVSRNPNEFRDWLAANEGKLKRQGLPRGFGNHRKYQSLDAYSPTGTGSAVETYVDWVSPPRTHEELMARGVEQADGDPRLAFDSLYQSMKSVASFGHLARFDYLTMVGKLRLARIEPGSTYLQYSTGPLEGARLLFGKEAAQTHSASKLDDWLVELDSYLQLGMQVLEDSLCNWQKSPGGFKAFRG